MSTPQRNEAEHREIWLQIPWYVNDRIDTRQRRRVEAHLRDCDACPAEVRQQRQVHEAMTADSSIEQLPSESLNRLRQRLDAAAAPAPLAHPAETARGKWRLNSRPALLAASVAAIAVTVSVAVVASRHEVAAELPDPYFTVSSPVQRPTQEVIRAVFAPTTTLVQLQKILDESGLKIVAGPSEAGVYSLATTRPQPAATILSQLRKHAEVSFAESTLPLPTYENR